MHSKSTRNTSPSDGNTVIPPDDYNVKMTTTMLPDLRHTEIPNMNNHPFDHAFVRTDVTIEAPVKKK